MARPAMSRSGLLFFERPELESLSGSVRLHPPSTTLGAGPRRRPAGFPAIRTAVGNPGVNVLDTPPHEPT